MSAGRLSPRAGLAGLYRFGEWLPIVRTLPGAPGTVIYRGERLGRALGLSRLWIAFSGYWPERGADFPTGTFKDLEAYTVLGRLPDRCGPLVVASAGNTASAFGAACTRHGRPCLLIVPAAALPGLALREPLGPTVKLVVLDDADYTDAIAFAAEVARLPGFQLEGGARNVGRRDGLATPMYAAVEEIGRLPDFYVQAVGSGVADGIGDRLLDDAEAGDLVVGWQARGRRLGRLVRLELDRQPGHGSLVLGVDAQGRDETDLVEQRRAQVHRDLADARDQIVHHRDRLELGPASTRSGVGGERGGAEL